MPTVLVNTLQYSFENEHLSVGGLTLDLERLLVDPSYLGRMVPGLSDLGAYTLRTLPFLDEGVYLLWESPGLTHNLLTGVSVRDGDFGSLFSFRTLLRQILVF